MSEHTKESKENQARSCRVQKLASTATDVFVLQTRRNWQYWHQLGNSIIAV